MNADGLLYPSRLDPAKHALALFEGRIQKLVELHRQTWYATGPLRYLLAEIIEHYDLAVIEEKVIPPRNRLQARSNKDSSDFGFVKAGSYLRVVVVRWPR